MNYHETFVAEPDFISQREAPKFIARVRRMESSFSPFQR